jgi:uncharacterized protein with ParB-like and HNH nuclease domain
MKAAYDPTRNEEFNLHERMVEENCRVDATNSKESLTTSKNNKRKFEDNILSNIFYNEEDIFVSQTKSKGKATMLYNTMVSVFFNSYYSFCCYILYHNCFSSLSFYNLYHSLINTIFVNFILC